MLTTSTSRCNCSWEMFRPIQTTCRRSATRISASAYSANPSRNPLGVHALVFSGGWDPASAKTAISGASATGYDILEIPLFEPETIDVYMTKNFLQEFGITPTASLGLSRDADISSPHAECAAAGEALLRSALHAAHGVGSKYLCGVIYSAIAKYPGPPTPEGRRNAVAAMRRIANEAADLGVVLCVEVINRYETNLLNTAVQAMEFLSDVNSPNLKIHLDSFHMNIEEPSMSAAVATAGNSLGYVHIGESHRGYLGSGTIAFTELFRALAASGYDGPITFESFSSRVVSPHLSNELCVWRNLWDDSDDLARTAREFMLSEIEAAKRHEALAR